MSERTAFREIIERVRLLGGVDRTNQTGAKGDQKFDFFRLHRQGGCRLPGIKTMRTRRHQNVDAPGVFSRLRDPSQIIQFGGTLGNGRVDLVPIACIERA